MEKAFSPSLYCLPHKHRTDKKATKILLRRMPCWGNPAVTSDMRKQSCAVRFTCWILAYANIFGKKVAQRCSPCIIQNSEYQQLVRNCGDFRRQSFFPAEIYITIKQFFLPWKQSYSIPSGQLEGYPQFYSILWYYSAAHIFLYLE